jgi:hypothetical protein
MHEQENQPKSFFDVAGSLVKGRGLQRIEHLVIRIRTLRRYRPLANQLHISHPMDALQQLLLECLTPFPRSDPRKSAVNMRESV